MKSAASVPGSALFIPGSAHVSGALGTNWRTDLEMFNPGLSQATVTVSLLQARQANSNPAQRTYTLDPGECLRHEDVLMSVFGFNGSAALRITNDVGMVAVTSRTYNLTDSGTYGQFVEGVINHTAIQSGQEGRIIQLTHNRAADSGYRTNIGFVNATGNQLAVDAALYRADGTYLGTKTYYIEPYEFRQIDKIFQKVTSEDVDDGYAVLSTPTAGGAFFAYGVVVDNRTGDPIYVTPSTRASSGAPPAPTTTPSTTATATPTATPTPTTTPTADLNLAPYQPDGWSGPLVVAGSPGTRTSGGLSASGSTYFSGAVGNWGPDDAVFSADEALLRLYLDSTALGDVTGPQTLEAGTYLYFEDFEVSGIAAGSHTATLAADPDDVIAENDEGDNVYDYVDTWGAKGMAAPKSVPVVKTRVGVAPIPGWGPDTKADSRQPTGIRWRGSDELKSNPASKNRAKALTSDSAIYIAAAAHVSGALDTNWRTDVQLHNPGTSQARVEVAMLVRGQTNPTPQTRTFTVAAGTSMRLEDILYSSFSFSGAAALRLTVLEGDIIATSRTYNLTDSGTYGQFAGSVPGSHAFVTGESAVLMQLTHTVPTTSGFRTNVGMVNLSGETIVLDLDFRTANGTSLGTTSYTLRPYEFIQKDRIFRDATSGSVDDGYIILSSSTVGARFLAYATTVDNLTGDSVYIPAASVLAAEPTAMSFIPAAEAAFAAMGQFGQDGLPSIETAVAGIQTLGMDGFIATVASLLPAGTVTPLSNGWRADLGSHFVAPNGDLLAGSITGTHTNLINQPGELSYDYEIIGENVLWNGQYAEIGGATGNVDFDIDSSSHVRGGVTMSSFAVSPDQHRKLTSDVEVTGSAEFDTSICPNYPISGWVTITRDGDSQTITFTNSCDGTFEGGSQGQTGDVSFRLTWSTPEDLDLYVREPGAGENEYIYYGRRTSPLGTDGQLDVDSNAGCSQDTSPTENVFWPVGRAPRGTYTFWVQRWSDCSSYGGTLTPSYTLRVFEGDTVVRTLNLTMETDGRSQDFTHEY